MFKVSFIHPLTTSYMYTMYVNHIHSRTLLSVSPTCLPSTSCLPPHPHTRVYVTHWVQLVVPAGMLAECWLIFWLRGVWVTPAAEFMSAAGMPCLVDTTHSPLPILQPVHSFCSIFSVPQPSLGGLGGSWTQMSHLGRSTCPVLLSTQPTSESAH